MAVGAKGRVDLGQLFLSPIGSVLYEAFYVHPLLSSAPTFLLMQAPDYGSGLENCLPPSHLSCTGPSRSTL